MTSTFRDVSALDSTRKTARAAHRTRSSVVAALAMILAPACSSTIRGTTTSGDPSNTSNASDAGSGHETGAVGSPTGTTDTQPDGGSNPNTPPSWSGFGTATRASGGLFWAVSSNPRGQLPALQSLPCPDGTAHCTLRRFAASVAPYPAFGFSALARVTPRESTRAYVSAYTSVEGNTLGTDVASFDLAANAPLWLLRFGTSDGSSLSRLETIEGEGELVLLIERSSGGFGAGPTVETTEAFLVNDLAHPEAGIRAIPLGGRSFKGSAKKLVSKDALVVETADGEIVRIPFTGALTSAFGPDRRVRLLSVDNGQTALSGVGTSNYAPVPLYLQNANGTIMPWLSERPVPATDGAWLSWFSAEQFSQTLEISAASSAVGIDGARTLALPFASYAVYEMQSANARLLMVSSSEAALVDLASGTVRSAAVNSNWAEFGQAVYPRNDSALFLSDGQIYEVTF